MTVEAVVPAGSYYDQGVMLYDEGDYTGAVAEFIKVLVLAEVDSKEHKLASYYLCEAHSNIGLAHLQAGDLDQAENEFRQALAINPEYADLQYQVAVINYRKQQYVEAEKYLSKSLTLNPDFAKALIYLGLSRVRQGDDEGLAYIARAMAIQPSFGVVKYRQAVRAHDDGDVQQFIHTMEKLVEKDAGHAGGMVDEGLRLMKRRAYRDAAHVFVDAVTCHPTYADLRHYLALCYIRLDMLDHAIIHLNKALEINPKFNGARVSLAMAHEKSGRRDRAVCELQTVLSLDPDSAVAARFLAMLQHRA